MLDLWGQIIPEKPRRTDRTNADRQARMVELRSDIGEIPEVMDPKRRETAWNDVVEFGLSYCMSGGGAAGLLKRPPSARLEMYARELQKSMESGGLQHVRLPRGAGKTTWIKIAILWGISTGRLRFAVVIAATGVLASSIVTDIWDVIESSDSYAEDFPEVSFPVRALDGLFQRAAAQSYHGERTRIRRTANDIRLPVIEGSQASGAMLVAKGAGCALRGLVKGAMRPDYVLLDDIQTRADAFSELKTNKLVNWVQQDVMGLGGNELLSVAMASTPIKCGDLSDQFADAELHPEWRTLTLPMISAWPERLDLWREYDELYLEGMQSAQHDFAAATEFYLANREAMDAGADVLDPMNYDQQRELSGLQHARNLLLRANNRDAFDAEYQLKTRRPMQLLSLDARAIATHINGHARGTLPQGTLEVVAYIDVMADAGLHFAVFAFGPKQTAAVVDYGIYPDEGRLVAPGATEREMQVAVARHLSALLERLYAQTYIRADGVPKRLHAVWIDHGWQTAVVSRVAALFRKRGFANTHTCAGRAAKYYDQGGKNVVAHGRDVDMRERDGVTFFMHNADAHKEAVQKAIGGTPLQAGSLSMWGDSNTAHYDFCQQIVAEKLVDKAVSGRGVVIYIWTCAPNTPNHYLDVAAGAFAMAAWYRFWSDDDVLYAALAQTAQVDRHVAPRPGTMPARRRYRSPIAAWKT